MQYLLPIIVIVLLFAVFIIFLPQSDVRLRSKRSDTHNYYSSSGKNADCNGITSSPILAAHHKGYLRRACRCHWPTLYSQTDRFNDCNVQQACDGGKGTLVHKVTKRPLTSATPPVDIHDYECSACDRCNVPGPDPHTGLPSCLPRAFNDRDRDMCIYNTDSQDSDVYESDMQRVGLEDDKTNGEDYRTTKSMLSVRSHFVDEDFVSAFTDRVRNEAWVPNPCAFDLFTGARLYNQCELRMTRKSKHAYCAPTKDNIMTAVKDDSYLANNMGRYPNACFRFTSDEALVNGYVIEYFLRRREALDLPSPVVSMRIAKKDVLYAVLAGLGLTHETDTKMLLFTQPEPPADVDRFPHPFNEQRMAIFTKEFNTWVKRLPAKCTMDAGPLMGVLSGTSILNPRVPILYNCSAPSQPITIPECSKIGESDRSPANKDPNPDGRWIGAQTDLYAKSTVACLRPVYDTRFPIVPNYNVSVQSINAEPTSAILFFNKTDNTVYPHWKEVGSVVTSVELKEIGRYVREELRSLPNEML